MRFFMPALTHCAEISPAASFQTARTANGWGIPVMDSYPPMR